MYLLHLLYLLFFFNDTATTEIYTLSLHDALPISAGHRAGARTGAGRRARGRGGTFAGGDRKSTRLNSSHPSISYAVFGLNKKKYRRRRTRAPQEPPAPRPSQPPPFPQ